MEQTRDDFEVIVSDDASIDDLRTVAESFRDSRIRYSRSDVRLRAARNHQRAVSLCRGTYVVNLHSDDLLMPNYLEIAGRALDCCEEAAAAYSSMALLGGATIDGCHRVPKLRFADGNVYRENPWLEKHHNVAPTCCMFRKRIFEQIGGYRVSLRFAYDWDLYIRFMTHGGGVLFLPEVLAVYRRHDEQASKNAAHEGLYDVLELWQLHEYSHWPSWEIADLALTHVIASVRSRRGLFDLFGEIRRVGVAGRLVAGGGKAIRRRLRRRIGSLDVEPDANYEWPANLEWAVREANALVARLH